MRQEGTSAQQCATRNYTRSCVTETVTLSPNVNTLNSRQLSLNVDPSLFIRSRSSCEDQPCVTGDRFVAGFAYQVSAGTGAEVEAVNAYAKWCKDQAQVDDHQQETIDASIASTNAAIENFAAKAESAVREKRGEGLQQI